MYLNSRATKLDVGHFFDSASNIANMNLNGPFCKVVQRNDVRIRGQAGKVAGREVDSKGIQKSKAIIW